MLDDKIQIIERWECPKYKDARIFSMPAIPEALRPVTLKNIIGEEEWVAFVHKMKSNACYKCEICKEKIKAKTLDVCDLYDFDFNNKKVVFNQYIVVCKLCRDAICFEELLERFDKGSCDKKYVLDVLRHCFNKISTRNRLFREENRVRKEYLDVLKYDSLKDPAEQLINMYDIEFFGTATSEEWGEWRLLRDNVEYRSYYKSKDEFLAAEKAWLADGTNARLFLAGEDKKRAVILWRKDRAATPDNASIDNKKEKMSMQNNVAIDREEESLGDKITGSRYSEKEWERIKKNAAKIGNPLSRKQNFENAERKMALIEKYGVKKRNRHAPHSRKTTSVISNIIKHKDIKIPAYNYVRRTSAEWVISNRGLRKKKNKKNRGQKDKNRE